MNGMLDFGEIFGRLAREASGETRVELGGMSVRLVRVAGGGAGQWDRHDRTAETVVVWSGDFRVAFRDHELDLAAGQCCVVPAGAEHRGTSTAGAEVILFQQLG